jgi:hypothetical protein
MALVNLDIRQSVCDPIPVDIGNVNVQGRIVSQTIQLYMFTTNKNAVWGGTQGLLKSSYPFARVDLTVNRKLFRHEVGDVFKFSYSKYGISNMILRILQKEELELETENIIVHCMEDIFSVNSAVTRYTVPVRKRITGPDYTVEPFDEQIVVEPPYAMYNAGVSVLPIACRKSYQDVGFDLFMSTDGGVSYFWVNVSKNITANGVLVGNYLADDTYSIDMDAGIIVEFDNDDVNFINTITWAETFAGQINVALLGDEIISFQSITPVTGKQYKLEGIIRGRYGAQKKDHLNGELFKLIPFYLQTITNSEIIVGADRKFKLIPYNDQKDGDIADCTAIDLAVAGKVYTPYIPINFYANGSSFTARYDTDIILTWNARKRGAGAGIGTPGMVISEADYEGLFEIEVWIGGVLKRTVGISALTWIYTETMSLSDNGSLPEEVTFKLLNYRTEKGYLFESEQVAVICHKNKRELS